MVRRYTAEQLHGDFFYTLPDKTEFVAASDHAALESERDELRRKLDAVLALCQPPVWPDARLDEIRAIVEGQS